MLHPVLGTDIGKSEDGIHTILSIAGCLSLYVNVVPWWLLLFARAKDAVACAMNDRTKRVGLRVSAE